MIKIITSCSVVTIACPECGEDIDMSKVSCPHGRKKKSNKSLHTRDSVKCTHCDADIEFLYHER